MTLLERVKHIKPAPDDQAQISFVANLDHPLWVKLGKPSISDLYDVGVIGRVTTGTSVLQTQAAGVREVFVTGDKADHEDWLLEMSGGAYLLPMRSKPRSEVGRQIEEIQRVTHWSDGELARAWGVRRETIVRWRGSADPNLRRDNLYRLGVLHALATRMEAAQIDVRVWLNQPVVGGSETPYELICAGRLGDVREAVDAISTGFAPAGEPMKLTTITRDWDEGADADDDGDEGEWIVTDPDEGGDE